MARRRVLLLLAACTAFALAAPAWGGEGRAAHRCEIPVSARGEAEARRLAAAVADWQRLHRTFRLRWDTTVTFRHLESALRHPPFRARAARSFGVTEWAAVRDLNRAVLRAGHSRSDRRRAAFVDYCRILLRVRGG